MNYIDSKTEEQTYCPYYSRRKILITLLITDISGVGCASDQVIISSGRRNIVVDYW